ncbi:response regulator [Legionella longbeachae]|uniref:response regulator n=1 Tax=Legionella longbeachae TaxID=450 RepID=UPI00124779BB|nr:response regulator [Legionella longbeachae]QEY51328.1 response regulator [Legionella longbeachae]
MSLQFDRKNRNSTEENIVLSKNTSFAELRILIVDDNPDIIDSLSMLLRCWDVKVQAFNNGTSALTALDEFYPHIVLLDIGIPDIDGCNVAEKIRQNLQYASIKLVALTGWNQETDRVKSKASGFNEHLAKPIDISDLCKLLNKLIIE